MHSSPVITCNFTHFHRNLLLTVSLYERLSLIWYISEIVRFEHINNSIFHVHIINTIYNDTIEVCTLYFVTGLIRFG